MADQQLPPPPKQTPMQYRYLGSTGLQVSAVSLGTFCLCNLDNEDTAAAVIEQALRGGVNFFDTAETYGATRGDCEIVLGRQLARLGVPRSAVVVSTKLFWGGDHVNERGLSRKHVLEGAAASLRRLGLDYVDVIYAHRPDPRTPMAEVVRAFSWLVDNNRALYWGTSEWSAQQITEAIMEAERLGLVAPVVEQPQYNLCHRERVEVEYAPLYARWGFCVTPYSPLASGMLTGKYCGGAVPEDSRFGRIAWQKTAKLDNNEDAERQLAAVEAMRPLCERLECSEAQLALAWCLKNPNVASVIMGASRPAQVDSNLAALPVVERLGDAEMEQLDELFGAPAGARQFR